MLKLFVGPLLLALQGCTGISGPPAISPALAAAGARAQAPADEFSLGRSLFVRRCIECHALPAIGTRSVSEWRKVLAQMAPRARLTDAEQAAVRAYVVAARATL